MFGSLALEIGISLSLLYLLLGLMCSVLNEWMAGILNMRAKNLWDGVRNLLYDSEGTGLAKQLYNHALVKNLGKAARSLLMFLLGPSPWLCSTLSPPYTIRRPRERCKIFGIRSPTFQMNKSKQPWSP